MNTRHHHTRYMSMHQYLCTVACHLSDSLKTGPLLDKHWITEAVMNSTIVHIIWHFFHTRYTECRCRINVDVQMNVEYTKKKRLNSLLNLFQETTDMHVNVHVQCMYTSAADQPCDKLDLSDNRHVG